MDFEQRSRNEDGSKILGNRLEVLDGNGNKKQSETTLEVSDANRSSMVSEKVADRNGSSSYFELLPEFRGGSERSDHFLINPEINPEVVDRSHSSKKSEPYLELTGSDDSCKHSRIEPDASISEGHEPIPTKKLGSSSSSSSSSVSSIDDLFQVNVTDINHSISPKANEDIRPTPVVDYNPKSEVLDSVSPGLTSTSQTSGITSEQLPNAMSPTTQSPPIQTMDRSEGYDPLRIPSSIFASSKPSTPMEWSVASNESLFSLQIGNSSFRDQVLMHGDIPKSGELFMLSPTPASAVAGADGQFSAPVPGNDAHNVGKNNEPVKDAAKSNEKDIRDQIAQALVVSCNSTNSNHSNESGISKNSFTFPVKKKCAWRSCYCSNCNWTFCYCTRPSWAFCCHWNRSRKRLHDHSSPILADGVRSASAKTDDEKQHHQPTDSKVAQKQASCGWFPCLSYCYPCSCSWPTCFRSCC
ncbi:uncharacterized protein LOC119990903 isoform X2 [Tripterygium wilfordii]|uniref:uncharacterized protein LOC119990903 isoform X2 n=1 Tax=Tripterygium wilfordii TaxID=458696 RepID=UPI0018F7F59F|nr:uncharacterized protein LOC119990903 isoform X2 [Tripterygium wilfordii]